MHNSVFEVYPEAINDTGKRFKKYESVDIMYLPMYSDWPQRLLNCSSESSISKTMASIYDEYENDKWGELLKYVNSSEEPSIDRVRRKFFGKEVLPARWLDKYYLLRGAEYSKIQSFFLANIIKSYESDSIIELGGGFGSIIFEIMRFKSFQDKRFFCGELTSSGRAIMKKISIQARCQLNVFDCDFHADELSNIELPKNSIIFTSLSICEVKGLGDDIIKKIANLKPKIVINLEASYIDRQDTLVDIMTRKYSQLNDYNLDFHSSIVDMHDRNEITIHHMLFNVMGRNPLRPVSLYVWSPVQ